MEADLQHFLTKRMWPNQKLIHSSAKFLQPPTPLQLSTQIPGTSTTASPPILKQCLKFSRRELAICTNSSLLMLLSSRTLDPRARAEDEPEKINPEEPIKKLVDYSGEQSLTKRVFLDVSIDGKPIGRIIIGLCGEEAPFGTSRFSDLVSGAAGISYRRKEFVKINPGYVQHGGVRSYGVDAELVRQAGRNLATDRLVDEWEKQHENSQVTKNLAGTVGIVVRDPSKPPPKFKLVARKGKLEIDQEEVGVAPNGTEFVISTKDSPELDASTLVVGRVLEGMDVVEKIGQVKTVQENTSSPYFRYLLTSNTTLKKIPLSSEHPKPHG